MEVIMAKHTNWIECTRPYRRHFKHVLRAMACINFVDIELEDEFGLIFGAIWFTVYGDTINVEEFKSDLTKFVKEHNKRSSCRST